MDRAKHLRTCVPEAGIKGRDKWLNTTVSVGCDYLSQAHWYLLLAHKFWFDSVASRHRLNEAWVRFLSPIFKPESLGFFPTSHLIVFYLHSKWLGSQVTWRNPKWLRLLTWGYLRLLWHRYFYFVSFWIHICDIILKILQYRHKRHSEISSLINYVFDATDSYS